MAGIRSGGDAIEQEGVDLALERIQSADLCLFLVDATAGVGPEDRAILDLVKDRSFIAIINKIDIASEKAIEAASEELKPLKCLRISALTGQGLDELRQAMTSRVFGEATISPSEMVLTRERHCRALGSCAAAIDRAVLSLESNVPLDLAAIDLRDALGRLGEITGQTAPDEILDRIFSEFCIGK